MKEAIGSAWIFGIVITFIALFSGFLAFSVNYSKAFKVKDGIIQRLVKYNGPNQVSLTEIADFLGEIGYNTKAECTEKVGISKDAKYIGVTSNQASAKNASGKYNYCIQRVSSYNPSGQLSSAYYKVVVFFSLSIPILDQFSTFSVSGETVNIYYPNDEYLY